MKKIFAAVIAVATLLSLLGGCGSSAEAAETTVETTAITRGSGVTYEEVLGNFEGLLMPICDRFTQTKPEKVNRDDGTTGYYTYVTDRLTGAKYRISISIGKTREVEYILMSALQDTQTELNFALLSYYLYTSLELPEMDADAFYEHFNLLTAEPAGRLSPDGWFVDVHVGSGVLFFIASVEE